MNGPGPLSIPAAIRDAMVAHCLREAPLECCGLLGGVGRAVASFHPLRNELQDEARYRADSARAGSSSCRPSRPWGEEDPRPLTTPTRTPIADPEQDPDLRENYWGDVPRIIVSLAGPEPDVRIWRLDPDAFEELPWQVS